MGVIPLKIRGEMPAIGSTSHCKLQGTKCRLEHLMRHHGLRSVRNSYETYRAIFSLVEIKETYGINYPKSKPHFFSSDRRGKTEVLRGYCRRVIVGIRDLRIYVGPWALSEDTWWSKDR